MVTKDVDITIIYIWTNVSSHKFRQNLIYALHTRLWIQGKFIDMYGLM